MNLAQKIFIILTLVAIHPSVQGLDIPDYLGLSTSSKTKNHVLEFDKVLNQRPGQTVRVVNTVGSVTVVSDLQADQILVTAVKESNNDIGLFKLDFDCTEEDDKKTVRAFKTEQVKNASIDLKLVIPPYVPVEIASKGPVKVIGTRGPLSVLTSGASVVLHDTHNTARVKTAGKGTIEIYNPRDHIQAETETANITVVNSERSVLANTQSGSITVQLTQLPEQAKITANVENRGNITLFLPEETSASFCGCTNNGILTCNMPITLDPFTTLLDQSAWKTFKKQAKGRMKSAIASINAHTARGNITVAKRGDAVMG